MMIEIWVNIGSGNGLVPDGTKPLPEPMLTSHRWTSVAFIWEGFFSECPSYLLCVTSLNILILFWKLMPHLTGANELILSSCWNLQRVSITQCISMVQCKTAITPLLTHWSDCSLALNHWYDVSHKIYASFCFALLCFAYINIVSINLVHLPMSLW